MSNLIEFAERELDRILRKCEDKEEIEMQKLINSNILDMIKSFSDQNHSGFSASYALSALDKLLRYKPLSALTGEDDEWVELDYTDHVCYQNKRCPSVFKDKEGRAYYTEARIFSRDNGHTWYTSNDSTEYIEFPFEVPLHSEHVIVDNEKERLDILHGLINILKDINKDIKVNKITEETELSELIKEDELELFETNLVHQFKIDNLYHKNIRITDPLWGVINYVMDSDKIEE